MKAFVHGEGMKKNVHGVLITSGYVETELVDGSGPGKNLVVRLDFDIRNKKAWSLDGISVTEQRVKHAMAALNIQVDNPLQCLPQDKVRLHLASSDIPNPQCWPRTGGSVL